MSRTDTRTEQREPIRPAARERKRTRTAGTNPYDLDRSIIPDGMDYNWKRISTIGQDDTAHMMDCQANGWEPVPAERHPGLMPSGYTGPIIIGDQMLMDRPMELTRQALEEQKHLTEDQISVNRRQLTDIPAGSTAPRSANLGTTFGPIEVPE